jgi:hypothetical protein
MDLTRERGKQQGYPRNNLGITDTSKRAGKKIEAPTADACRTDVVDRDKALDWPHHAASSGRLQLTGEGASGIIA